MSTSTESLKKRKLAIDRATADITKILLDNYWSGLKPNTRVIGRAKRAARAAAKILFEFNTTNPLQYLYHTLDD